MTVPPPSLSVSQDNGKVAERGNFSRSGEREMRGYSSCVRVSFWWGIKPNSGGCITSGKLAGFAAGEGEVMNLLGSPFTSGTEKLQH